MVRRTPHACVLISTLAAVSLMVFAPSCAASRARSPPSGIALANMDRAVRPQDDFFGYANGAWLRTVPIPADRSSYGVQQLMIERSLSRQRSIAESALTAHDPDERKVGTLYASFMDERRVEAAGLAALDGELEQIDQISDAHALVRVMGRLDRLGMTVPVSTYVAPDAHDPRHYALWLSQNDLGLPSRDYYLSSDLTYTGKRAAYREHVATMLRLSGDADAVRHADAILALETAIARLQWAPVDRRDPKKTYNPRSPSELQALAPEFDWVAYFSGAGMAAVPAIAIARQPDYLAGVAHLTKSVPLDTWKVYLRYLLVAGSAPYLPQRFASEDFAFNQGVLRGTKVQAERWKQACALVDRLLGDAAGKLYVERNFSPHAKARAEALVKSMFAAYAGRIRTLDWMAPATKQQALAKLATMTVKIGNPTKWRDYSALDIRANDLLGNVLRGQQFEFDRQHRRIGGSVDMSEWQMTVPTPDAYYSRETNEIVFPAGILQQPLFDPDADDAFLYGSTGATIGHEMSHAFDNRGSQFDGAGNLRDWWTSADRAQYDARTAKLVAQFDGFEPLPGEHINGKLVLSENIADLAGLSIAWRAYVTTLHGRAPPVIDGLTGAQRFFIGYAQSYLGKRRDDALLTLIKTNPHPPERYRVNGIVVHLQPFYSAFDVSARDPMFLSPNQRAVIW